MFCAFTGCASTLLSASASATSSFPLIGLIRLKARFIASLTDQSESVDVHPQLSALEYCLISIRFIPWYAQSAR